MRRDYYTLEADPRMPFSRGQLIFINTRVTPPISYNTHHRRWYSRGWNGEEANGEANTPFSKA